MPDTITATYLVTSTGGAEDTRELVDVEDGRPELPVVLERIDAIVRETTSAMDAAGATPEGEWIAWDRLLDAVEADRERAADLDPAGVRYELPDGRTVEATLVDVETLDGMVAGFVAAALWADCGPLPTCDHCERVLSWGSVDYSDTPGWVHRDDDEALCRVGDPESPQAERDENAETGGLQHLDADDRLTGKARALCAAFLAGNRDDVQTHMDALGDPDGGHPGEFVGHTFYLTAAGHGVAFTDRGPLVNPSGSRNTGERELVEALERLETSARTFRDVEHLDVYQVDDTTASVG